MKCPTCGSNVKTSTGDEGTSCFMPEPSVPISKLEEFLKEWEVKAANYQASRGEHNEGMWDAKTDDISDIKQLIKENANEQL